MDTRPKIKLNLTIADKVLNTITLLMVLCLWGLVLYSYNMLPDTIVKLFDAAGNVNEHGDMSTVFKLPIIGTSIFIILSFINRFPYLFNYPLPITEENAERNYALSTTTMRMLNAIFILIILLLSYKATVGPIGKWPEILISLVGPFIPVAYYLIKLDKANKIP